ncbi:carbohydrate-binding protein with CBM35 doain [Kribbella voronezhensis]|uniref:Carbohydrate-binding protein with CBM35 doain n=1 Tax=Kribbella voronezhensis TaxID=2512212 RepID=A0A4R7TEK3_9ACTN|nr:GDSL-type esterase/lipase family protein [Kribbella voronezhensis]TDU90621.1 carbohydrate-binding protein with CBM35 doain [Kribbella voronezhensis]
MRVLARALPVVIAGAALALNLSPGLTAGRTSQSAQLQAVDDPAVPINRATPTKLMPLGDSNTAGGDAAGGGYRTDLWQLLKADGRPVDFVGSVTSGSAALGDKNHEGHGGWTIGQLQAGVVGWLNTYQPDVVTLQIGTNDMYDDASAGAAPGKLSTLIDTINATLPNAKVFVSNLPQLNDANHYSRVAAFNAIIPGIVAAKAAAGKPVSYLDANSGLYQTYDFVDTWHPNYGAASKAAARWYAALTGAPLTRLEAEQTANATVVHATRVQITSASGGGKIGYIDYADSSVTFKFQVGAAGNYRIRARGANGTGTNCTHKVSANGGPAATVTYPSYSWDLLGVGAVDVALTAGQNTVKFSKGDCYTELDAIDVGPVPVN